MNRTTMLLACLLFALPLVAQDKAFSPVLVPSELRVTHIQPPTERRGKLLIGLYVTHEVLQGLDAWTTIRAVNSGCCAEANPILAPMVAHPPALYAFKFGLGGMAVYGMDSLFKGHHPRAAKITMAIIDAAYVGIVVQNYRLVKK